MGVRNLTCGGSKGYRSGMRISNLNTPPLYGESSPPRIWAWRKRGQEIKIICTLRFTSHSMHCAIRRKPTHIVSNSWISESHKWTSERTSKWTNVNLMRRFHKHSSRCAPSHMQVILLTSNLFFITLKAQASAGTNLHVKQIVLDGPNGNSSHGRRFQSREFMLHSSQSLHRGGLPQSITPRRKQSHFVFVVMLFCLFLIVFVWLLLHLFYNDLTKIAMIIVKVTENEMRKRRNENK